MIKRAYKFFDKLEDRIRAVLSHHPIIYSLVGGIAVVLFWRGVWLTADIVQLKGGIWTHIFSPVGSIITSVIILLLTGLFVSFFITDRIILSGMKQEKKLVEKTESEVRQESTALDNLIEQTRLISKDLEEIKKHLFRG